MDWDSVDWKPPEEWERPHFEGILSSMLELEDNLMADCVIRPEDRDKILARLRLRMHEHVALFDKYYP